MSSWNVASRKCVWKKFDTTAGNNTVVGGPGSDAAVVRVDGTDKGLAITVDGNGRYTYLDPYTGGMVAVAEAARNLAVTGAEPLGGLTDGLNFGNPEKPEVYWQLQRLSRVWFRLAVHWRFRWWAAMSAYTTKLPAKLFFPPPR